MTLDCSAKSQRSPQCASSQLTVTDHCHARFRGLAQDQIGPTTSRAKRPIAEPSMKYSRKLIYTVSAQAENRVFLSLKSVTYAKLIFWSGRQDSNLRPPHPQCDALPGCATSRPPVSRWDWLYAPVLGFARPAPYYTDERSLANKRADAGDFIGLYAD